MVAGTDNDILFAKYKRILRTIEKLEQLDELMKELYFNHYEILEYSEDFDSSFSLVYSDITNIIVKLTNENNLRLKKLKLIK